MGDPVPEHTPPVIVIGVTGGVAAYKTVEVVSRLKKAGYAVHVTMTEAAMRFVSPLTFAAVSGHSVMSSIFPDAAKAQGEALYPHLYPSTRADVFMVIPATANMLAKLAHGEGSDPVSVSALSLPSHCLRMVCPAMNVDMWEQDVVQQNMRELEARGWIRLGPGSGMLACGMEGAGRVIEPDVAVEFVHTVLKNRGDLAGKRILILSGPTREHLDPVRFISNLSSGRMGKALAEEAARRGADVTFITGPVAAEQQPAGARIQVIPVVSAMDMLTAAERLAGVADMLIFAAAVADYRPVQKSDEKRDKGKAGFDLALESTPDIAATLSTQKRENQYYVGFALQSGDGLEKAREKMARKKFDVILLNHPESMGAQEAAYTLLSPDQTAPEAWGLLDKRDVAIRLFDHICSGPYASNS